MVSEVTDGPISPVSSGVRQYAVDPERARALWAKSEEMVGERFWPFEGAMTTLPCQRALCFSSAGPVRSADDGAKIAPLET
jgi:hypothetical protein